MKPNTESNMTSTKSAITHICESLEKIEREAAAAAAAVTTADEEYQIAKIDDGKTDPGEIFDRKTAAKKKLFVCQAEAKRAATKAEAAEFEFAKSIEALAEPLLANLAKIRAGNAERLTKELAPKLLHDSGYAGPVLKNFVDWSKGVREFDEAIGNIQNGIERMPVHGAQTSGLVRALKQAERLV
jgi:hypothetical protein